MSLIIATRKSKLAQVQTERVMELLKEQQNIDSEKLLVVTEGDKRLDVTLDKIGGKGLFTKEIEIALIEGKADGAVHSMKDVPFQLAEEFELVAMPEREDVRDAFISRKGINFSELRQGAKIGTSSNRRAALLKEIRSDLEIVPIRGNVQTRLKKMEEQELDGIILASAGLKRLGMEEIITDYFDPNIFIPAIGQGALGIECLKNSKNKEYFKALDNKMVRLEVEAERSFMKALNGDCHSLIGAYSIIEGSKIYMIGTYMGKFISCVSAEDKLAHCISYMAAEIGFPIEAKTGVYSSDSTPFADSGIPALSFARIASSNVAPIHCRYDVKDVMSMEQLQWDIDFLVKFTERFANAAVCPVAREIPEKIKKELDEYLARKRKEQ